MKKFLLFFLLLCFAHQNSFAQSGWTRNARSLFINLNYAFSGGDKYFDANGVLNVGANNFLQQSLNVNAEYGITKSITGIFILPAYKIQKFDGYSEAKGVGNPVIELKFALSKKIPVISFTTGAEFPLATQTNFSVAQTLNTSGLFDRKNLPTGYPDFHFWGTWIVSSALGNLPGWISIHGKFIARTAGYSNQFNYGFEVGYKWTPKFRAIVNIGTQNQIGTPSGKASIVNGEDTEFTKFGFEVKYKIAPKFNLHVGYQFYNDVLNTRKNIYSSPAYQFGVSYEL